ncbi:MAG: WYL domain-containing protein [Ferruginibacter sp.]
METKKEFSKKEKEISGVLCDAINKRKLIRFYYQSVTSGKKGWRTVEPYIIGVKENGNVFLAALPITELSKKIEDRSLGHYLINRFDISTIEVLEPTYQEPRVERFKIDDTHTIEVLCRYYYKDEQ